MQDFAGRTSRLRDLVFEDTVFENVRAHGEWATGDSRNAILGVWASGREVTFQ